MVNPQHAMSQAEANVFCSVLSREAGEPLYGTALHNDVWFLLEYEGPWGEKAVSDNDLPPEVQTWLSQQAAAVGRGRVQFIKQERESPRDYLSFYVAATQETASRMLRLRLSNYTDLLQLDVRALLEDEGNGEGDTIADPLYLVCTNGRRDRCCALFGLEAYYALRQVGGDAVWQTTHVGGHRFAANVLTFPDGTYYGRVQSADDIAAFYEARQRGEIVTRFLRGRSCYEEWVQAADYFLRRETGERALDAFTLEAAERVETGDYEAVFTTPENGRRYTVRLQRHPLSFSVLSSCGKPGEGPCEAYRLLSLEK